MKKRTKDRILNGLGIFGVLVAVFAVYGCSVIVSCKTIGTDTIVIGGNTVRCK